MTVIFINIPLCQKEPRKTEVKKQENADQKNLEKEKENGKNATQEIKEEKKEEKKVQLKFWQIPLEIIRTGSVRAIIQSFEK